MLCHHHCQDHQNSPHQVDHLHPDWPLAPGPVWDACHCRYIYYITALIIIHIMITSYNLTSEADTEMNMKNLEEKISKYGHSLMQLFKWYSLALKHTWNNTYSTSFTSFTLVNISCSLQIKCAYHKNKTWCVRCRWLVPAILGFVDTRHCAVAPKLCPDKIKY